MGRDKKPPRKLTERWLEQPGKAEWKDKAFRVHSTWNEGGEEARNDLRRFVWEGLTTQQREEWVGTAAFGSKRHNLLLGELAKSLRGKVVVKRANGGELGQPNAANPQGERHKKKIKKYNESDHGKAKIQTYLASDQFKNTRAAYKKTDEYKQANRKYFTSDKHFETRARRREEHYSKFFLCGS